MSIAQLLKNEHDVTVFESQKEAMASWSSKYKVYSINTAAEIEIVKGLYPEVSFIETNSTCQIGEKILINLDGILDAIKSTGAKLSMAWR